MSNSLTLKITPKTILTTPFFCCVLALIFFGCNNPDSPLHQTAIKEGDQTILVTSSLPSQTYPKSALLASGEPQKPINPSNSQPRAEEDEREPEYLFLASTLGAPKTVISQMPYRQGQERIVRFRFEEKNLKIYQSSQDNTLSQDPTSEIPVMTIPIKHVRSSSSLAKGSSYQWQKAPYFTANFNQLTLSHLSVLNIVTKDDCFGQISQRAVRAEVENGVMNIEIEREYELKNINSCIIKHLDVRNRSTKINIATPSFKIRYAYSIVRLDQLISRDYQPITYPKSDQLKFGFFSTQLPTADDPHGDPLSSQDIVYLDRFHPGAENQVRQISYHLNASFNKPENLYLRELTRQGVESVNNALKKADANIQINLVHAESKETEKSPGDLRYNMIFLVEKPLSNSIVGYGPHVSNPRTGEIVRANINMYLGTFQKMGKKIYQEMIRQSQRKKEGIKRKSSKVQPISKGQMQELLKPHLLHSNTHSFHDHHHDHHGHYESEDLVDLENEYKDLETRQPHSPFPFVSPHKQEFPSLPRLEDYSKDYRESEALDKAQKSFIEQQNLLRLHAQNNAYHVEMINEISTSNAVAPDAKNIPGVVDEHGVFKPWTNLTRGQRKKILKAIISDLYQEILIHELGHNLGLRHNFMGSVDRKNFYTQKEIQHMELNSVPQSSSVMDYPSSLAKLNTAQLNTLGKYDIAALKYAYARKVELSNNQIAPIPHTLEDLTEDLSRANKKIKTYSYCTDEHTDKSPLCNHFDQGTNLLEVTRFYINSYQDRYFSRNWRNGRWNFSEKDLPGYIIANMRAFRILRKIFNQFELSTAIYGPLAYGCTGKEFYSAPSLCMSISNSMNSALLVGNFFLDIIKTPDHTCDLKPIDNSNPERKNRLVALEKIYHPMSKRLHLKHIPKSCFDQDVQQYLKDPRNHLRQSYAVQGEVGKYLNSIKEPDFNQYPHKFAIGVRGIWSDKLLAMRYLTSRLDDLTGITFSHSKNMTGAVFLKPIFDNLLNHLITNETLLQPIKFKDEKGKSYQKNHLELTGSKYKIKPQLNPLISLYMGLPRVGAGILNQALIANAFGANGQGGFEEGSPAQAFQNELSVITTRRTTSVNLEQENHIVLGQKRYIIGKENRLANILYRYRKGYEILQDIPVEEARAVLQKRTTPPQTQDIHISTVLNKIPKKEIKVLIQFFSENKSQKFPLGFYRPPYHSAMTLGVEGLEITLRILEEMDTPPPHATENERAAYSVELDVLREFVKGNLEKRSKSLEVGLQNLLKKIDL